MSEDVESSDEYVMRVDRRGRRSGVIYSDSEDEEDEDDDDLDRSSPDTQSGSSSDMTADLDLPENFHLRRHGRVN